MSGAFHRGMPLVRPVSWSVTAIHLVLMAALIAVAWTFLQPAAALCVGSGMYLAYSLGSRSLLTRAHRKGVRLSRTGRYSEAIHAYEESFRFFSRHPWLDRFRAIAMLSPAALSYREMALCNMAFCHAQLGQGAKAKDLYRAVLAEFPGNALAATSLLMIESGEQMALTMNTPTTAS
jgi:tetratricopeptide (TPR) repeat protein